MKHFKLTQEHIDDGIECNTWECPAALCLREAHPGCVRVSVGLGSFAVVLFADHSLTYLLAGSSIVDFIQNFDAGNLVEPMEFDLPDPQRRERLA